VAWWSGPRVRFAQGGRRRRRAGPARLAGADGGGCADSPGARRRGAGAAMARVYARPGRARVRVAEGDGGGRAVWRHGGGR